MRRRFPLLVVIVCALAGLAETASAATITVDTTSDPTVVQTGGCSLRRAIAAVNSAPTNSTACGHSDAGGNTIVLPASPTPYRLTIAPGGSDDNLSGDLDITGTVPLTIQGAGVGLTTIDASALHDRILHLLPQTDVTITGLTLTGGHAPDGAPGQGADTIQSQNFDNPSTPGGAGGNGGGILNNGFLTLTDALLTANRAGDGGTGGASSGAHPGRTASNGGPAGAGGAIYNTATLTVQDTTFSANQAGDGGVGGAGVGGGQTEPAADGGCCGDGGAIENAAGTLDVARVLFTGNHAGKGGGGGTGGDSHFQGGQASSGGQGQGGSSGGAIASLQGTAEVTDSTFSDNLGGVGGDGGFAGSDSFNLPASKANGGGAGNGSAGGAIFVRDANLVLDADTITADQPGGPGTAGGGTATGSPGAPGAPGFAGGVDAVGSSDAEFKDALLSVNPLGNCHGTIVDDSGNLSFGDSTCPATFLSGDPLLGSLRDNGGVTQTIGLGAGSPAIDHGVKCPPTDQRRVARPSGAGCDIGAYEITPPATAVAPATGVTASAATLLGIVTANSGSADAHFEFGTTTAYGQSTATQTVSGVDPVTLTPAQLIGLAPATTYHFRVVATSADGSSASADATFTTAPAPSSASPAGTLPPATTPTTSAGSRTAAPALFDLRAKPKALSGGRHAATTISYLDSEPARTTLVVFRVSTGARRGKRCVKRARRSRASRCALLDKVASLQHSDKAGRNHLTFTARVGRRRLAPGAYELRATPRLAGLTGRTLTLTVRIR